jgi:1-deoxy-D-xylulose-5-phosphate synthase
MDEDELEWALSSHRSVLTVEEGIAVNGFGSVIAARAVDREMGDRPRVRVLGVPDRLIHHAARKEQLQEVGLTPDGIAAAARELAAFGVSTARESA